MDMEVILQAGKIGMLKHCRDAFQPELLKRLGPGETGAGGLNELIEKSKREYQKIMTDERLK